MKILVVGDVFLDQNVIGKSDRISPEAPVPVVSDSSCSYHLGGAANVAKNLSVLGAEVSLLTLIGEDKYATIFRSILKNYDINFLNVDRLAKCTNCKVRFIVNQQQLLRHDIEKMIDKQSAKYIADYIYKICNDYDLIIISDYNKGLLQATITKNIKAHNNSKPILVDSKSGREDILKYATVYKPNLTEINLLCSKSSINLNSYEEQVEYIISKYKIQNILLTLGNKGMLIASKDNGVITKTRLPVYKRDVYDVTGAGDTVLSIFGFSLLAGKSIKESAKISNYVASKAVTFLGTYTPTKEDLVEANQYIVFTNGCFDILHIGHIKLLEYCKSFGGKLIVGLNSDESVKKLKGNSRPFNNVKVRKEMLEYLKSVDEVIIFNEETPYQLIKKIQPDIIVKGGDYKKEDVIGKDLVEAKGGKVEIFPIFSDYSTSKIAERIKNNA